MTNSHIDYDLAHRIFATPSLTEEFQRIAKPFRFIIPDELKEVVAWIELLWAQTGIYDEPTSDINILANL